MLVVTLIGSLVGERANKKYKADKLFAALDLGTNSCRMLVVRPRNNNFEVLDSYSKSVDLGNELEGTGYLSKSSMNKAMKALKVCKNKLDLYPLENSKFVATEACRRAKNGRSFLKRVQYELGLKLHIITPEEEAKYAVIGCAPLMQSGFDNVLVVDIGGGSTELVWLKFNSKNTDNRLDQLLNINLLKTVSGIGAANVTSVSLKESAGVDVVDWLSIPLGVSTLSQKFADIEEDGVKFALMSCDFEDHLSAFLPFNADFYLSKDINVQLIGTSGTITTLGAVHLGLQKYDRDKVDGLQLTSNEIDTVIRRLLEMGPEGRKNNPAIGTSRCDLIIPGVAIIQTLLRNWPGKCMKIADRGLRDGILQTLIRSYTRQTSEDRKEV